MNGQEDLKKQYQSVLLMGIPMVSSLLLYWGLVQFVVPPKPVAADSIPFLRLALYVVATTGLVVMLFLKKLFLQKKPEDALPTLLVRLKIWTIIAFALCEAPAIYGLVLYFSGGSRVDFYVLGAFSLLLFAVFFPKQDQWREYAAGATDV